MWSYMCMSYKDISLSIFLKIALHYLSICDIVTQSTVLTFGLYARYILELYSITRKKTWKPTECILDIVNITRPIESISLSKKGELIVPKIKLIALCFSITNLFEKGITLTHNELIVFLYLWELFIYTRECKIHSIPTHTGSEVEKIHIKRRYIYCSPRECRHILWFCNLTSLHCKKTSLIILEELIILWELILGKNSFEYTTNIHSTITIKRMRSR